jgi:protein-S-isoprenylcysteine O-methyltransferase Ste14
LFYIGALIFSIGFIIDLSVLISVQTAHIDKPFTKGPYRYSMHPIYLSSFLILIGIAIICLSWVFLLLAAIVEIHQLISAPAEEKFCLEKYGDLYREYMEKTPRWIGFPKS